jgi:hypothetical protein
MRSLTEHLFHNLQPVRRLAKTSGLSRVFTAGNIHGALRSRTLDTAATNASGQDPKRGKLEFRICCLHAREHEARLMQSITFRTDSSAYAKNPRL